MGTSEILVLKCVLESALELLSFAMKINWHIPSI